MMFDISFIVLKCLFALVIILMTASFYVYFLCKRKKEKDFSELVLRIKTWWWIVAIFSLAISIHKSTFLLLFAFISFLALKEYFSLIPTRRADRRVLFWGYMTIPIQYIFVRMEWYGMFLIFIPVYTFLFIPFRMVIGGQTERFLSALSSLHWGLMTMVFSISHVAYLLVLPNHENSAAGPAGLVLYLIFLTQINDVAQYIWGKSLGKIKVLPTISPNKTLGGLLGGIFTTGLLGALIAPVLTPMSIYYGLAAGLLISMSGFIGDVTISALKRDLGVKDFGTFLPGHGGILYRIDSLTYTAPLFFHFYYYNYC
jgi:phosphatidate cytidylyltransferase